MSINGVSPCASPWQWQNPAASAQGTGTIANAGTIAASGTVAAFLQAFSADLQSMLARLNGGMAATGSAAAPDGGGLQAAASQAAGMRHHRHHHHPADGAQQTANQLVGEIGGALQGGTLSADRISQSASVLATDVMQALQAYGSATPSPAIPLTVA